MKSNVSHVAFIKRLAIGLFLINLFVIILACISIRQSRLQYERSAEVTTSNLAQVLEEYVKDLISKIDLTLLSVAEEAAGKGIKGKAVNADLRQHRERVPELDGLWIADARGNISAGSDRMPNVVVNVADRDYFIYLRDNPGSGVFITKPVIGRVSGKWMIIIARRLSRADGSFGGVVYGTIWLENLEKMFARIDVGRRGAISLFDNDLGIICRYPEPDGTGSLTGRKLLSAALLESFAKGRTESTYKTRSSVDGIERTFSYRKVSLYPFFVNVGLAKDDYLSEWRKDSIKVAFIVMLFFLVTLCLAGVLARHISARIKAEEDLRNARDELEMRVGERTGQLRELAAHLQSAREEDRTRIARDIHDELGQALVGIKMDLSWFRNAYRDHQQIIERTTSMLEALNTTIRSVKQICAELRPSLLDDFGLAAAIEWQSNEFQKKTGIECSIEAGSEDIELDREGAIVVYRIFQEVLTNIYKHAKATKVWIRLIQDGGHIIMEVIDNGIGIKEGQTSKPGSFGLIGMRERVYSRGGEVYITNAKDGGTAVRVILPIQSA